MPAPVKNSTIDPATFKANYKQRLGQDYDTRCFDGKKEAAIADKDSGGGGSNLLAFLKPAVGFMTAAANFMSNPVGTVASLLTGKKDIM